MWQQCNAENHVDTGQPAQVHVPIKEYCWENVEMMLSQDWACMVAVARQDSLSISMIVDILWFSHAKRFSRVYTGQSWQDGYRNSSNHSWQPWWLRKYMRTQNMSNLEVDVLQQKMTTSCHVLSAKTKTMTRHRIIKTAHEQWLRGQNNCNSDQDKVVSEHEWIYCYSELRCFGHFSTKTFMIYFETCQSNHIMVCFFYILFKYQLLLFSRICRGWCFRILIHVQLFNLSSTCPSKSLCMFLEIAITCKNNFSGKLWPISYLFWNVHMT